jgi:dTDP-glucose pyrophosphorylase
MRPVTKAVILARGLGTRMRRADPVTTLDPHQAAVAETGLKAMMPVGRPFLDYVLSGLADAGFRDACLVIGPEHEVVREYYTQQHSKRLRVTFALQPQPRGTADAVTAAEGFANGERFLVINSDNYYPVEALHGLRLIDGAGLAAFAAAALVEEGNIPAARVARWPAIRSTPDGWLTDLVERAGSDPPGDEYVSVNCWMFTAAIFPACRAIAPAPSGELEVQSAVRHALTLGERFRVLPFHSPVLDITSRADVISAAARLAGVEVRL